MESTIDAALVRKIATAQFNVQEAIERTPTSPLRDTLTTVNIYLLAALGVAVKIALGSDPEEQYKELPEG